MMKEFQRKMKIKGNQEESASHVRMMFLVFFSVMFMAVVVFIIRSGLWGWELIDAMKDNIRIQPVCLPNQPNRYQTIRFDKGTMIPTEYQYDTPMIPDPTEQRGWFGESKMIEGIEGLHYIQTCVGKEDFSGWFGGVLMLFRNMGAAGSSLMQSGVEIGRIMFIFTIVIPNVLIMFYTFLKFYAIIESTTRASTTATQIEIESLTKCIENFDSSIPMILDSTKKTPRVETLMLEEGALKKRRTRRRPARSRRSRRPSRARRPSRRRSSKSRN